MAKKKSVFQGARDIWQQALGSVKSLAGFFRTQSRDKRTVRSTQKAAEQLFEGRRPKEVAEQLGISYQRATSLKKQIREGRAYSPELRDILKEAAGEYHETPRKLEGGVMYFPNKEKLQKTVKHLDHIKTFPELEDARRFWKRIISSDKFIAITQVKKKGKDFYQVVGFGKRSQRPQKGVGIKDKRAKNRIDQILSKYGHSGKTK